MKNKSLVLGIAYQPNIVHNRIIDDRSNLTSREDRTSDVDWHTHTFTPLCFIFMIICYPLAERISLSATLHLDVLLLICCGASSCDFIVLMFELVHVMSTHVWVGRLQSVLATVCGLYCCVRRASYICVSIKSPILYTVLILRVYLQLSEQNSVMFVFCWTHWDVLTSSKPSFIFYTTSFLTIPAFWFFTYTPPTFLSFWSVGVGPVLFVLLCCVFVFVFVEVGWFVSLSVLCSVLPLTTIQQTLLCSIVVKKQRSP